MLTNGVDYQILWSEFKPGTSIFIPAIDTKAATEAMKKESERLEFQFVHKVVIEDGVQGIRVWRL
jgi:intergrase/recombinase